MIPWDAGEKSNKSARHVDIGLEGARLIMRLSFLKQRNHMAFAQDLMAVSEVYKCTRADRAQNGKSLGINTPFNLKSILPRS